ncbi:MAG: nuclear transport factor 2 family protein [Chloroflexota bacterium]|nr:nuclear transport factor 2 family protein [Chloroflexota bacterium]
MAINTRDTAEIMDRFNDAFLRHQPKILDDLVGDGCVMEGIQPAPDGTRVAGREACLAFWHALAGDPNNVFTVEDVTVSGERAVIRWRYHYGERQENAVRGVNLMQVRDSRIVEALGYAKVPGEFAPLSGE